MRNLEANTISVEDVLHTLRECHRDWKYEGAFEHMVAFASELTGLSEDFLIERMHEKQAIDFSKVTFRDFDDTGVPAEFFFKYEAGKEQKNELIESLGFRSEGCVDVEIVLEAFDVDCYPVEAMLTYADGCVCWADLADSTDELDSFIRIVRETDTERAREAMACSELPLS